MESLALAVTIILAVMLLGFLCSIWAITLPPKHVSARVLISLPVLASLALAVPLVVNIGGVMRLIAALTVLSAVAALRKLIKGRSTSRPAKTS